MAFGAVWFLNSGAMHWKDAILKISRLVRQKHLLFLLRFKDVSTMKTQRLSIRINLRNGGRFGPGKAELLRAISQTGSIRQAALLFDMSYPRALKLLDEMNTEFSVPVVATHTAGSALTDAGHALLAAYDELCALAEVATEPILKRLDQLEK